MDVPARPRLLLLAILPGSSVDQMMPTSATESYANRFQKPLTDVPWLLDSPSPARLTQVTIVGGTPRALCFEWGCQSKCRSQRARRQGVGGGTRGLPCGSPGRSGRPAGWSVRIPLARPCLWREPGL